MNGGALRFARYACPPNALGYCGPGGCGTLLEYANAGCGWNDLATLSAAQARTIRTGDTISLHWDWVCETLTPQQLRRLRHYTATQLRLANAAASVIAPEAR